MSGILRGRLEGPPGALYMCYIYGLVMPKRPNTVRTIQITISTTTAVQGYLKQLAVTGLFGKNPAEVAERIIARTIQTMLADGTLRRPRGGRGHFS